MYVCYLLFFFIYVHFKDKFACNKNCNLRQNVYFIPNKGINKEILIMQQAPLSFILNILLDRLYQCLNVKQFNVGAG